MNANELAIIQQDATQSFTSMSLETIEDKARFYNAVSNPDERLRDHINEVIAVKDVFVEMVECANEETGETTLAPRIVLIADDGKTYQCVSTGIFAALKRLFAIFGAPTWETPIRLKVKQVSNKQKQLLTLAVV